MLTALALLLLAAPAFAQSNPTFRHPSVGETMPVSSSRGASASIDAPLNLNRAGKALDAQTGAAGVGACNDSASWASWA